MRQQLRQIYYWFIGLLAVNPRINMIAKRMRFVSEISARLELLEKKQAQLTSDQKKSLDGLESAFQKIYDLHHRLESLEKATLEAASVHECLYQMEERVAAVEKKIAEHTHSAERSRFPV